MLIIVPDSQVNENKTYKDHDPMARCSIPETAIRNKLFNTRQDSSFIYDFVRGYRLFECAKTGSKTIAGYKKQIQDCQERNNGKYGKCLPFEVHVD
jgi:hypothetical protein